MHRILRPGGISLMSFSNRCFPTKAVAMWLQADDIGRLTIVGSYYHYSAEWRSIEALDPRRPNVCRERSEIRYDTYDIQITEIGTCSFMHMLSNDVCVFHCCV